MFTDMGKERLSDYIDTSLIGPAQATLASLSGDYWRLAPDDLRTTVTLTVEQAWHSPIEEMTCEHLRMLVGQKMGLRWISGAVAEFVDRHPTIEITHYAGELAMLALYALPDIEASDPAAAAHLRSLDYSWMEDLFSFSPQLQREAAALVAALRP
jgi:hypothetical protein